MDKYRKEVINFKESVKGGHFFCYDTETTGLSATENDIIEFSAFRIEERDGEYKATKTFDTFINPGYHIPEAITKITGISDGDVRDAPDPKTAAKMIRQFLGERPNLIGYNSVSFDQGFVNSLYRKTLGTDFTPGEQLDVLTMAREKLPKPHKLIDAATYFGIADNVNFHSSIADAAVTFEVFKRLIPLYDKAEPRLDPDGFKVTGAKRWKKSETLDRIYVGNSMNLSVYLDVPAMKWNIGGNLEDGDVIRAVYAFCNVSSDAELAGKIV